MSTIQEPGRAEPEAPPTEGAELDAFISYARRDQELDPVDGIGFIDRLLADLTRAGKRVWIDRSEIEPAAEWRTRIARGIEAAKALLFVLTPRSAASAECARELQDAVGHHKRIIPVVLREVPDEDVPQALRDINWIRARPQDDYAAVLADVIEALESDLEWRDAHARLATRTREWTESHEDRSFLLRGRDLKAAEDWYGEKGLHKEEPTDAQFRYITASRRAASGRLRVVLGAVTVALGVAVALGIIALIQRNDAVREQHAAAASSLSAQSAADLSGNFNAAGLESLESFRIDPTAAARNAVVTALEQPTTAILRGHRGPVTAVAYSPDGTMVASGGEDGTLRLWNPVTRREVGAPINLLGATPGYETGNTKSSGQVTAVAFSAHGGWLAAASVIDTYSPGGVAVAGSNSTLTIWSTAGGVHKVHTFADSGREITHLAFSSSGALLAVAADDGSVVVVDMAHLRPVAQPSPNSQQIPSPSGVAFGPDGELAFVSGESIRFWDPADDAVTGPRIAFPGATAFAFDPRDPSVLAAVGSLNGSSGALALFDTATGRQLTSLTVSLTNGVNDLAFSPDGGMIAVAVSDEIPTVVVDVGPHLTLGPVQSLDGASDLVSSLAFSPDSSDLATANEDGTVRIFTVPGLSGLAHVLPGSEIGATAGVAEVSVAALNNGRGSAPATLRIWNLHSGAEHQLSVSGGFDSSLALSPDGRSVAVGNISGSIRLLSTSSGQPIGSAVPGVGGEQDGQLAFSPAGRLLATAGNRVAHVVTVSTRRLVGTPLPAANIKAPDDSTGNKTNAVAFSPDGSILAVGDEAGQVRLWRVAGDRLAATLVTAGGPINRIAFSPQGDLLAVIADGQVELWNVGERRRLTTFTAGENLGEGGLAFSPNGRTLAAVVGCQLDLWDPVTLSAIGQQIDLHYVAALAQGSSAACDPTGDLGFAADGSLMVNLGPAGPIYVWSPLLVSTSAPGFTARICAVVGHTNPARARFAAEVPGQAYKPTCKKRG
jgi:WD40 repeat protein